MVIDALGIPARAFQGPVTNCGCQEAVAIIVVIAPEFLNCSPNRVFFILLSDLSRGNIPNGPFQWCGLKSHGIWRPGTGPTFATHVLKLIRYFYENKIPQMK